jgi:hypothetical protein
MLKKEAVINFIKAKKSGRTFTEIQRFICDMNGLDFDEKHPITGARRYRGYWCTNLLGTGFNTWVSNSKPGILRENKITKINGKWVYPR